ncbi:MAG TPA: alpha/beta hydrolase [Candidatus Kryptobacter bacterium]|nr:alpha/beta hydrolase [Candidatus Kryptobacter bacterium]
MDTNQIDGEMPGERKTFGRKMKNAWTAAMKWLLAVGRKLWPGAAVGSIAAVLVFAVILGSVMATGLGTAVDISISIIVVAVATVLVYLLVLLLLKIVKSLPARFVAAAVASSILLLSIPISSFGKLLLFFGLANGALIGFAFIHGIRRILSVAIVVLVLAADVYLLANVWSSGTDKGLLVPTNDYAAGITQLTAPDPSLDGPFKPKLLFYGSGWDHQRPEYGKLVAMKTLTVDVTPFFSDTGGIGNKLREWYWGFDLKHCPLNARVWYPEGNGPFPLVLIVHGNHQMEKYSDAGYDYLGRLLAGRGFIMASVDENFLNGNWVKDFGQKENFTRGWILLKHLEQWRKWDSTPGNSFFGKVDTDNIVLIGHSRGGQAVAIAAMINRLPRYYTDAKIDFDFGFKIKGIVQIAPNDPYEPTSGHHVELRDINYLILQGGYDGDMSFFMGDRQYNRVSFSGSGYCFKSAVYIYRANHGQFNTSWGRTDNGVPLSWLMNLKPIMKPEEQEKAAKLYISAFLEVVLHGKKEYTPFLRDFRTMADRLPKDYYVSQFEDSNFKTVADYEEGLDVTEATMPGVTISGENLKTWSLNSLVFRDSWNSSQQNNVAYLGWDRKDSTVTKGTPRYAFTLSDSALRPLGTAKSNLVFSLCSNRDDSGDSLDISVELKDWRGNSVELPLSEFAKITPPLKSQLGKYAFGGNFGASKPAERVLQTFILPLETFAESNRKFDAARLKEISLVFDRSVSGEVALDNAGIEEQ